MTTATQRFVLVTLRTLIGWHFLYEGYTKLLFPAWTRGGAPAARWSSAAYLKAATGPFADAFHAMGNASWIGTLDLVVAIALVLVGLSLMLGFFTQAGCIGAIALLATFYASSIPMGRPEARAEGTYLLVNKNLIEAAAVMAIFTFRTGRIAGLDRLWGSDAAGAVRPAEAGRHGITQDRTALVASGFSRKRRMEQNETAL
jgi:thiosulfate dehydrogenase (quinone) large subunit